VSELQKRQYRAVILITDDYSDSKDFTESKEIPLSKIRTLIETERLDNEGFSITEVEELTKL
jgi:hypothetical protein